jgi:hypothetical protein
MKNDPGEGNFTTGLDILAEGSSFLPPWLFQHEDLLSALGSARTIERKKIVNIYNYHHFMDSRVLVLFSHPERGEGILLPAWPEPCLDGELSCRWENPSLGFSLDDYRFRYMILADEQSVILIPGSVKAVDAEGMTLELPDEAYTLSNRQAKRFACRETEAELLQSSFAARGELVDFSPVAFRIRFRSEPGAHFPWYNPNVPAAVRLASKGQVIFSGLCSCVCMRYDGISRDLVLSPQDVVIHRFASKKYRSPRKRLSPPPTVAFAHPFFPRRIQREIVDISNSGFSVAEKRAESVMMPGMIIPALTISYAGALHAHCSAQVMYREEKGDRIVCGVAILDMSLTDYSQLAAIVGHQDNPDARVSSILDMEALWEFLFDTGFIYPQKYRIIQGYRDEFKETYRKLYQESPEIARHFTYEKDGRIYAHASMIKAYERSWLGHHLAARPMEGRRMGMKIIGYVFDYLWNLSRLPSARMDYMLFYFRPDNKFSYGIFGETATAYDRPDHCSTYVFSYNGYEKSATRLPLPEGWTLQGASPMDLWQLELHYRRKHGGLMFDAMDLGSRDQQQSTVTAAFATCGFNRRSSLFSLFHGSRLAAVIVADQSDLGMNLSEFLNSLKILLIDPISISWDVLQGAIAQLSAMYTLHEIPVLIHPAEYFPAATGADPDRYYMLWILSVRHMMEYFDFMEKRFGLDFSQVRA